MPNCLSVLSGPVTRTWCVCVNARMHTVALFHNTIVGERSLSVDGTEVPGSAGRTHMFSTKKIMNYDIDGKSGTVTVEVANSLVTYWCHFDGVEIQEENDILADSEAKNDFDVNRLKITIENADIGVDRKGNKLVWFKIHTVRESDERETRVHRRFRDFYAINEALRSAYKGSHLLSSFPELPSRSFKLFEDHTAPAFCEKRRFQLQSWLLKASQIPRMRRNPDFLTFLGIIEGVRECSVLFPPETPLGISLRSTQFAEVSGLKALPDGQVSPVQASGMVKVGDKISKINGQDVLGDIYDVVVAKLKSAPRPLLVHFLGSFSARPLGDGDGVDMDLPVTDAERQLADNPPPPRMDFEPVAVYEAPAPAPAPEPALPEDFYSGFDSSAAISGLIGEGTSYIGTGATIKPAAMKSRKGLEHHAVEGSKSEAGKRALAGVV